MAGVRDQGPRRRSQHYVEQPDRVNASQRAALGGCSSELVRNPGYRRLTFSSAGNCRPDARGLLVVLRRNGVTLLV